MASRPEYGQSTGRRADTARILTRLVLPIVIAVVGLVFIFVGVWELGVSLIAVAGLVAFVNWFVRLSMRSAADREEEDEARERFTRTGHW